MILGIDFGLKNIGLAITDDSEKLALALRTIDNKNAAENIVALIKEKNITQIVLGNPIKGNGEKGFVTQMMDGFISKITESLPKIPVHLIDESMTTNAAINELKQQGYSYDSIQKMKDAEAAKFILQSFIDNK